MKETGGFRCCKKLCNLNLPKLTTLSGEAFRSCPNLRSVTLNNVTSMDVECFNECVLDKMELPKLESIYQFYID